MTSRHLKPVPDPPEPPPCTCDVRGPFEEDVTFDDACPYHGTDGSMVARLYGRKTEEHRFICRPAEKPRCAACGAPLSSEGTPCPRKDARLA